MNRLESTIKDIHEGLTINALSDDWNRTAKVLVEEIDRLNAELAACRTAPPPRPAAIVRVAMRNPLHSRLILFADQRDAVKFYLDNTTTAAIFIYPDTDIVWHPATTPDTAAKPIS